MRLGPGDVRVPGGRRRLRRAPRPGRHPPLGRAPVAVLSAGCRDPAADSPVHRGAVAQALPAESAGGQRDPVPGQRRLLRGQSVPLVLRDFGAFDRDRARGALLPPGRPRGSDHGHRGRAAVPDLRSPRDDPRLAVRPPGDRGLFLDLARLGHLPAGVDLPPDAAGAAPPAVRHPGPDLRRVLARRDRGGAARRQQGCQRAEAEHGTVEERVRQLRAYVVGRARVVGQPGGQRGVPSAALRPSAHRGADRSLSPECHAGQQGGQGRRQGHPDRR